MKYELGIVKVVVYDKDGKVVVEKEIYIVGKFDYIELVVDCSVIDVNGKDFLFVIVKVVDKEGNFCLLVDNEISFKVKGVGIYCVGVNGNLVFFELFQILKMKVFSGMMIVIVQFIEKVGKIIFEVIGKGLKKGILLIESK